MAAPARFPSGVTNAEPGSPLSMYGMLDSTRWHEFWSDFDSYVAADWTVTETQGLATQALVAGDGGLLALVNTAVDDDINAILSVTSFRVAVGKRMFFRTRLKVDDATQSEVLCGLTTAPTAFNPAQGIYFFKTDGVTGIRGTIENLSGQTNFHPDVSMANDTFIDLAWYYNGKDTITGFANGVAVGSSTTLTFLPTAVDLGILLGVRNGDAVARTLTVDYVFAAKER